MGNRRVWKQFTKTNGVKTYTKVLTLNDYRNWLLNRKLKTKSDPLFATPATRNVIETRGITILSYVPKLSEKLRLILLSHGIRTAFKPHQKLGGLLSSFKDAIEPGYRQGAICKINCSGCDQCYIGETKRWFETRKKEHMRDMTKKHRFPMFLMIKNSFVFDLYTKICFRNIIISIF